MEGFLVVAGVVLWLSWIVVNALIAKEKGRSDPAAAVASVIFSPLIVWLYYVAVPPKIKETTASQAKIE